MSLLIDNVRGVQPGQGVICSCLLVRDGIIVELDPSAPPAEARRIDGDGGLLTPGLIDIHTHAIEDCVYESGPEALLDGLSRLGRYGVTCVLPTLYRVMARDALGKLEALAQSLADVRDVVAPGFHLEGPFLALPGAGAMTIPGDVGLLDEVLAAAGRVAAMSISPETPGILPVIERLRERGVAVFMTHTRAGVEQTQAAIHAGARHATHFYDVFPLPEETEPGARPVGAVETILADARVSVDFIADGVHVHPEAIRAALAAKGHAGIILITDANIGAGLPDGVYDTAWGYPVKIEAGNAARIHDPNRSDHGLLAGSALTMDLGMTHLLNWLPGPEHMVWQTGTANPARLLGLASKGGIQAGMDADLVLWDQDEDGRLQARRTWVAGKPVFDRAGQAMEATT